MKWCLGVIAAFFAMEANAEPSPTVSRLMNREASAFSFGMYRLQQSLQSYLRKVQMIDPTVSVVLTDYDWDRNRIIIFFLSDGKEASADVQEKCRSVIDTVREDALLLPKKINKQNSMFSDSFFPIGYERKSDAGEKQEIDKIIEISYMRSGKTCVGTLVGTGFSMKQD